MTCQIRITADNFCIGTTLYPKGSVIDVATPVKDYLVSNGQAVSLDDEGTEVGNYSRRDMQAERTPVKTKPRRKRRTKAEMEIARANGKA